MEIECAKMSALVSTMLPEGACVPVCCSAVVCPSLPPSPPVSHTTKQPPHNPTTDHTDSEDSSEVQEIPLPNVKNNVLAKVRAPLFFPTPCVCSTTCWLTAHQTPLYPNTQQVIEFLRHHTEDPMNDIEKPLKSANMHEVVQDWYANYVNVDQVRALPCLALPHGACLARHAHAANSPSSITHPPKNRSCSSSSSSRPTTWTSSRSST